MIKQYIVDAFADKVFSGNPAAVCILEKWLKDELMMDMARENNLSETAFAVKIHNGKYHLRWFTPGGEIDLCGHATLATAYVIMNYYEQKIQEVRFETLSGELFVKKKAGLYEMDFPAYDLTEVSITDEMIKAIGIRPSKAFIGRDLLCILDKEEDVKSCNPNLEKAKDLDGLLLHVTASGKDYDCVSRSFAPKLNVAEDPVCGSGHCHIIPYWAKVTGKKEFKAYQASQRGGTLYCTLKDNGVTLAGKACLYAKSELYI
ncbi:PhzF family phenazine biosynthesis protein [Treponema putidum]|uniref:PhzF family phenazine biosynthesis protein n=1 Tax=Treponema putidum TaxID=221027 RepID=UPI002103DF84|nr:PhzF family phenazine biosynthesis protein [Treponema putidum]